MLKNLKTAYITRTIKGATVGIIVLVLISSFIHYAYGEMMTSPNYRIQSDSMNFGGTRSVSGSYISEDSMGEIATGYASSTNYILHAGYQQMHDVQLVVVPPTSFYLSPNIGGITGGVSNGSTTFSVMTDDAAGYSVTIQASSSPALTFGSYSFADYAPTGLNPDFTFASSSNTSSFGFSVKGSDADVRFFDNASQCGVGSSQTTNACWDGLSTSSKMIANRTTSNQPAGTVTTLNFRAASGNNHVQIGGTYTATTTITIVAL
ncbi:MAG: hypothetical protein WCK03_01650 [Candidatus Taylorbacteria bacterium]